MRKFALVGCGSVAAQHAKSITDANQLIAVCDTTKAKADALAREYSAKAYYDFDEMLTAESGADVVVVCTPNGTHAEQIIKSLQARKHVICEASLCLTTAAAWQIIETEKFCRRNLLIAKRTQYSPLLAGLSEAFASGQAGRIYSFSLQCFVNKTDENSGGWRSQLFPGGGPLYTTFNDTIDALQILFGNLVEAKGFYANNGHSIEDAGAVALQMQNGAIGTMNWCLNTNESDDEVKLTVVTEKGRFCISGKNFENVSSETGETNLPFLTDVQQTSNESADNFYKKIYADLGQALDKNSKHFPGAHEGLKTVEVIEKIYKALGR